jgi:hypothetical protein
MSNEALISEVLQSTVVEQANTVVSEKTFPVSTV